MESNYVETQILPRFSNHYYLKTPPRDELLAAIRKGKATYSVTKDADYTAYRPKHMMRYLAAKAHFPETFNEKNIVDIGDREGVIKQHATGTVTTLDKNNPDLQSFDWDVSPLPYPDRSFETVFCLDTLEHISDFHKAFEDLLRISSKYVVISLPNCWKKGVKEMILGRGFQSSYGLPLEKPIDRHYWFINTEDIEDFMFYSAEKHGFNLTGLVYFAPKTAWWHFMLPLFAYALPVRHFKNLMIQNVFVRLERR